MNIQWTKETVLILILGIVVIASGADLVADLSHGADTDHVIKEAIVVTISILAIAWLLLGLHRQKLEILSLQRELDEAHNTQAPPGEYVVEARRKLGNMVSRQFMEWSLTESEKEVGWLLLKGLSLKEIALVRQTQEKTVRQQASSIYRKSGVSGRHAFSAWFIEDIL
jgi:DNA-binding CsgD family transcriptional regulator